MLALTLLLCADLPAPLGRVSDFAHTLSAVTVSTLEHELAVEEEQTSNQIVVITVASLDGQTIEDLAIAYGKAWHVGQKGKDNGVVFLIAPSEHKMRIEVGKGLEGALTDLQTHVIQEEVVRPALHAGDFNAGTLAGERAIVKTIAGEFVAPATESRSSSGLGTVAVVLMVVSFGVFVFAFIFFLARRSTARGGAGGSSSTYDSNSNRSSASGSSGSDSSGGGDSGFSGGGGDFGGGGSSSDF